MNLTERAFYDSVVHGLRSRGWPRDEAEEEALNKVDRYRSATKTAETRAAYQRDLRTIKRLGLSVTVSQYRKSKET